MVHSYWKHVSHILKMWEKKSQIVTFGLFHISYNTSPLYVLLCLQTVCCLVFLGCGSLQALH